MEQLHQLVRVALDGSLATKLPPAFVIFAFGLLQILADGRYELCWLIRAHHDGIWLVLYCRIRRRQNLDDFSIQVALPEDLGQFPACFSAQCRAKNKYIEGPRLDLFASVLA